MIELNNDQQIEMVELFLKHFNLQSKLNNVMVSHPASTKAGCIHIDIGCLTDEKTSTFFSFGCSNKQNLEKKFAEAYLINKNNIECYKLLQLVTGFNNKQAQLVYLQNGEYICFDDKTPLGQVSNGRFVGFFIYDSFTVTTEEMKEVHYYELVPVTKTEVAFVESHPEIPYKKLILALKDYLGDRPDLTKSKGLQKEKLDEVLKTL